MWWKPWDKEMMAKCNALTESKNLPKSLKDFKLWARNAYAKKGDCWINIAFIHDVPRENFTSLRDSELYYWFNENQCTAYLEPVHGSSNATLLAKLLFLGEFIDIKRLTDKIADCLVAADSSRKKSEVLLLFGIKARRDKDLTTFIQDSAGERKCHLWVLKPDNLVEVHCDRPLAPLLKKVLFTGFNSQKDRHKMIEG